MASNLLAQKRPWALADVDSATYVGQEAFYYLFDLTTLPNPQNDTRVRVDEVLMEIYKPPIYINDSDAPTTWEQVKDTITAGDIVHFEPPGSRKPSYGE